MAIVDDNLRQYATDRQWEVYLAFCEAGSGAKAAADLGVNRRYVDRTIKALTERALRAGEAPDGYQVTRVSAMYDASGDKTGSSVVVKAAANPDDVVKIPDPRKIFRTSTLYAGDGSVTQQWVLEKAEDVQREALWKAFADGLAADLPRAETAAPPALALDNLLTHYGISDHHMGQLSWGAETRGDNYDVKIGEQLLADATNYLVSSAPPTGEAIVGFYGDFLHTDGYAPMTPHGGHLLDADVRFPKIAAAAARAMRNTVGLALTKHAQVRIIITAGNHDPVSAVWLRIALAAVYENEPRVTVDDSPSKFHYYEWGRCLFGWTHGDRIKIASLPGIMAVDMAEAWGRTLHRYIHTGHVHHDKAFAQDLTGVKVESHRVLAPNDAYAAKGGYRTPRDMKAIVYHREFGETGRLIAPAAMFRREAA
jgi:hypothetical protein